MTSSEKCEFLDKYTAVSGIVGRLFLVEYEFLLLYFLTPGPRASSLRSRISMSFQWSEKLGYQYKLTCIYMLCIDFHRNWLRTGGEIGYYFLIGRFRSSIPASALALFSMFLVSFNASRRDLSNGYKIVFCDGTHLILFDLKKNIHYSRKIFTDPNCPRTLGKKFLRYFTHWWAPMCL